MSLRELLLGRKLAIANMFSIETHDITTRNELLQVQVVILSYYWSLLILHFHVCDAGTSEATCLTCVVAIFQAIL